MNKNWMKNLLAAALILAAVPAAVMEYRAERQRQLLDIRARQGAYIELGMHNYQFSAYDKSEYRDILEEYITLFPERLLPYFEKARLFVLEGKLDEVRAALKPVEHSWEVKQYICMFEEYRGMPSADVDACLRETTAAMRDAGFSLESDGTPEGDMRRSSLIATMFYSGELSPDELAELMADDDPMRRHLERLDRAKMARKMFSKRSDSLL
jgi:hypothetical protein